MEKTDKESCNVCVTGGAGYIGSALVKSLLHRGYTVHTTLRNLDDESKVGLLRNFPGAEERLHLFAADIYKPEEFEAAIQGCKLVFHVATPIHHTTGYEYKDKVEATVGATKKIVYSCIKSRTVRRLIYTGSVVAASPLKADGNGYKTTVDETCWTPFDLHVPYSNDHVKEYTQAKTMVDEELLKIGQEIKGSEMELVTIDCGLVGGGNLLPYLSGSVSVLLSPITKKSTWYHALRYLEELLGKIPIIHVDDVCRAHIFCAETPSVNGRYLCASSYVSSVEISKYYQNTYPEFHLDQEFLQGPRREIRWGSRKLEEEGFSYKYDTKMILDDCVEFAKRLGEI